MPTYKVSYTITGSAEIEVPDVEDKDEARDEVEAQMGGYSLSDILDAVGDGWDITVDGIKEVK